MNIETKTYADGTVATGVVPLPEQSPAEQAASTMTCRNAQNLQSEVFDSYKRIEDQPEVIARCPCCGSAANAWSYTKEAGDGMQRVVMCEHVGCIGPRDDCATEACLLHMPPADFYQATVREAVRFWNRYAEALALTRRMNEAA